MSAPRPDTDHRDAPVCPKFRVVMEAGYRYTSDPIEGTRFEHKCKGFV